MNESVKNVADAFVKAMKENNVHISYNGFGITEFKAGEEVIDISDFIVNYCGFKPHKTWTNEYKQQHQVHPMFRI